MFDKLIVSEPEGADFKGRRGYFIVSSLIVGVLFITAVVLSIFAADFALGDHEYDLVELTSPELAPDPVPQTITGRPAAPHSNQTSIPPRPTIASVDEPTVVPNVVSTSANNEIARIAGERIQPVIGTPGGASSEENGRPTSDGATGGLVADDRSVGVKRLDPDENTAEPPPVRKPSTPASPRSLGVVNGRATSLPRPPYPPVAVAAGAQGKVTVQVTIDEKGQVISARAIDGHPLLRSVSEQAAMKARFTPTELSRVPVKVTGVIVYNFTR